VLSEPWEANSRKGVGHRVSCVSLVDATTVLGSRELPPASQRVVPIFEHIARALGHPLSPADRILDFGAGAGRHVAEFRDAGYDAWGIDHQFTSHSAGAVEAEYLRRVEPPDYRLPFPDGAFDFIYSTSVMEHVVDPGRALAEIARVLRPGHLSIHVFPSRWRPIEPHIFVPFGGRFQSFALMRLWALLGIKNTFQRRMPATDVALVNTQYCKTGLSYPTAAEWRLRSKKLFAQVGWGERHFIRASRPVSGVSRKVAPFIAFRGVVWAYRGLHTRVLVLRR
jgi:SAM-dependent methyltransferase